MLKALYKSGGQTGYKKRVIGSKLLRNLDADIACEKCPQLKLLLDTLLEIAEGAGQ